MRISDVNPITGSATGVSEEVITVDPQYTQTRITINGLATGTATFTAKPLGGEVLEVIEGASINLATPERTIILGNINDNGVSYEEIGITVSAGTAFTYYINQV